MFCNLYNHFPIGTFSLFSVLLFGKQCVCRHCFIFRKVIKNSEFSSQIEMVIAARMGELCRGSQGSLVKDKMAS